jgi:hypothetical protein
VFIKLMTNILLETYKEVIGDEPPAGHKEVIGDGAAAKT